MKNIQLDKSDKDKLKKILVSLILATIAYLVSKNNTIMGTILYLLAYLVVASRVLQRAWQGIKKKKFFSEHVLMAIATLGALVIGEYPEAIAVIILYEIGCIIENLAVGRSKRSIENLLEAQPEFANLDIDGTFQKVTPDQVAIGSTILVKAGEKVPLDGIILAGESTLNTAALTGESTPISVSTGMEVLSGSVNGQGSLTIKTTKGYKDSAVARILDLVENASDNKAPTEKFISKFSNYYTPVVVIAALILAILPPLFFHQNWATWFERSLVFLVISCPCALVISVPLGFFAGIGAASKNGVLIKGSNYLEALNDLDTIVFDKTGTLTEGTFSVTNIISATGEISDKELLAITAAVEQASNHPIAKSILAANTIDLSTYKVKNSQEIPGHGLSALVNGKEVRVGNDKAMKDLGINIDSSDQIGTKVYVSEDKNFLGTIIVSDAEKPDAKDAIKQLKDLGVNNIVMLTGDDATVANEVGEDLGITEVHANLLPEDKVSILEKLQHTSHNNDKKTAFAGDGINDTPVLTLADVGIAMGGLGSDAAVEASDMVIMNDQPSKITTSIKIAKFTRHIVVENIIFALIIKGCVILLGTFGLADMWEAVFADVGVTVLAVLNTIRILKKKNY